MKSLSICIHFCKKKVSTNTFKNILIIWRMKIYRCHCRICRNCVSATIWTNTQCLEITKENKLHLVIASAYMYFSHWLLILLSHNFFFVIITIFILCANIALFLCLLWFLQYCGCLLIKFSVYLLAAKQSIRHVLASIVAAFHFI